MLNLYLLSQSSNRGYDTYDSCVVAAPDEIMARMLHPRGDRYWNGREWAYTDGHHGYASVSGWTHPDNVKIDHIGVTLAERSVGVICASFNAG